MSIRRISKQDIQDVFEKTKKIHQVLSHIAERVLDEREKSEKLLYETLDEAEIKSKPEFFTPFQIFGFLFRKVKDDNPKKLLLKKILEGTGIDVETLDLRGIYIPSFMPKNWQLYLPKNKDLKNLLWEILEQLIKFKKYSDIGEDFKEKTRKWNGVGARSLSFVFYQIKPGIFFPLSKDFIETFFSSDLEEIREDLKEIGIAKATKLENDPNSKKYFWKFMDWFWKDGRRKLWEKFLAFPMEEVNNDEDRNILLNIAMMMNLKNLKPQKNRTSTEEAYKYEVNLYNWFRSKGFLVGKQELYALWNALRVKGFVLLAGLTGVGKTSIAVKIAELLSPEGDEYKFLSVKPNWSDSSELLGWYNPIQGKPIEGEISKFLHKMLKEKNGRPYFLILDEMNLSHIEYYFAEFLSVLESGREKDGATKGAINFYYSEGGRKELRLPRNFYIIGTLNTDETTKSLSPKVLDRSFVIEFREVKMEGYPPELNRDDIDENKLREIAKKELEHPFNRSDLWYLSHWGNKVEVNKIVEKFQKEYANLWGDLKKLNENLSEFNLHFGYRIIDEISLFVLAAANSKIAKLEPREALDLAVKAKVLPKFFGTVGKLKEPLRSVICWADGENCKEDEDCLCSKDKEGKYPLTKKKACQMCSFLEAEGFASYF